MKNYTDTELVKMVEDNSDYLSFINSKCKEYCLMFLRKLAKGSFVKDEDLKDIYQDSLIVLYEKIRSKEFHLSSTIQTYLNSVCRNQLLKKLRTEKKVVLIEDESRFLNENLFFDSNITDELDSLEPEDEKQFSALEKALNSIKEAGGNCYELVTLFWYHNKSMEELTAYFGYSNANNTKNQKARCQKRIQKLSFNYLH